MWGGNDNYFKNRTRTNEVLFFFLGNSCSAARGKEKHWFPLLVMGMLVTETGLCTSQYSHGKANTPHPAQDLYLFPQTLINGLLQNDMEVSLIHISTQCPVFWITMKVHSVSVSIVFRHWGPERKWHILFQCLQISGGKSCRMLPRNNELSGITFWGPE